MSYGYMGKILEIDVTHKTSRVLPLPEDLEIYLGGKGFGARLLYDLIPAGIDPLGPQNVLIFATGPYTGTFAPQSVRFSVTTLSPLTNIIANDSCGGDFAMGMKRAGFDIVIVKGVSEDKIWIEINEESVQFHDATALWGMEATPVQEQLPKRATKAVIGPAGEHLVKYACIVSGDRMAGRAGVGAVMGSKNIKAITATGKQKVQVADPENHKALTKWLTQYFKNHPLTGDVLPTLGTANLVLVTNARNMMPVNNFKYGNHPDAYKISGQEMASKHLQKNAGCTACPIHCGREVRAFKKLIKGPEYESVGLLGSNLGIFDMGKVIEISHRADEVGIDTISAGGTIAWAMEANQRGLWNNGLNFGDADAVLQMIDDIGTGQGLGKELALGSKRLSETYGGTEFAIHVKGMEVAAYDPRGSYAQGLEYATASRGGDHINGATMFWETTGPLSVNPLSTKSKAELVAFQQNFMAMINCLITCTFSAYAVLPSLVSKLEPNGLLYKVVSETFHNSGPVLRGLLKHKAPLAVMWYERFLRHVTGRRRTLGDIMEMGERSFTMERMFNVRQGITAKDDTLPKRFLNEPRFESQSAGVPLNDMIGHYYKIRGWDKDGIPDAKTLKRLNIRV